MDRYYFPEAFGKDKSIGIRSIAVRGFGYVVRGSRCIGDTFQNGTVLLAHQYDCHGRIVSL
jgi:hypothetical protein